MRTKPITLALDFDGCLHDQARPVSGRVMGLPLVGAKEAMDQLEDRGFLLVIHTVRARTKEGEKSVRDWLNHYGFPYHDITAWKPNADVFVDDRAIRHINWTNTLEDIYQTLGIEHE